MAITIGPIDNSVIITKIQSNRSGLRLVQKNPDKSGCKKGRAECKAKPREDWMLLGRGSESACVYVGGCYLQVRLAEAKEACSCTQVSWHYFRILSFISWKYLFLLSDCEVIRTNSNVGVWICTDIFNRTWWTFCTILTILFELIVFLSYYKVQCMSFFICFEHDSC